MLAGLLWAGGLALTAIGFLLGKVFTESERILGEKRRIYAEFLQSCPVPNDVYSTEFDPASRLQNSYAVVLLYASPTVTLAVGRYFEMFDAASPVLKGKNLPLHEAFRELAKAHNDIILEMRQDSFAWSAFGYRGPSRLPADALEKAKLKAL